MKDISIDRAKSKAEAKKRARVLINQERSFVDDMRTALVRYRANAKLNQAEIGAILGISRTAVSNFEAGISTLREEAMVALFRLLRDPCFIISDQLRNLADFLVCPDFDSRTKLEELTIFAQRLFDNVTSILNQPDE